MFSVAGNGNRTHLDGGYRSVIQRQLDARSRNVAGKDERDGPATGVDPVFERAAWLKNTGLWVG